MPAEVRRRRADEQRAEFMNLPSRRCDHQDGRAVRSGERLRSVAEKYSDYGAGEMLVRRRDAAVAPQISDGLRQRRDHALEQPLRTERGRGAFQHVVQPAGVERLYSVDALIKERRSSGCSDWCRRAISTGSLGCQFF